MKIDTRMKSIGTAALSKAARWDARSRFIEASFFSTWSRTSIINVARGSACDPAASSTAISLKGLMLIFTLAMSPARSYVGSMYSVLTDTPARSATRAVFRSSRPVLRKHLYGGLEYHVHCDE